MTAWKKKTMKTTFFFWNPPEEFRKWNRTSKEQEGRTLKKSLAIPETSSETPLENSEIVNTSNTFILYTH